jgi:hypothetical protein
MAIGRASRSGSNGAFCQGGDAGVTSPAESFSLVLAQTSPSNSKLLSTYRGWVDLMGTINALLEMDKQLGLSFGKDQAKKIVPILKHLQTREDLRPQEALEVIEKLERGTASSKKQQQYLETAKRQRDEEIRQANASGGRPNLPFVRISFALFGMVQAVENDTIPYNPFRGGPGEDDLQRLKALLEQR